MGRGQRHGRPEPGSATRAAALRRRRRRRPPPTSRRDPVRERERREKGTDKCAGNRVNAHDLGSATSRWSESTPWPAGGRRHRDFRAVRARCRRWPGAVAFATVSSTSENVGAHDAPTRIRLRTRRARARIAQPDALRRRRASSRGRARRRPWSSAPPGRPWPAEAPGPRHRARETNAAGARGVRLRNAPERLDLSAAVPGLAVQIDEASQPPPSAGRRRPRRPAGAPPSQRRAGRTACAESFRGRPHRASR